MKKKLLIVSMEDDKKQHLEEIKHLHEDRFIQKIEIGSRMNYQDYKGNNINYK